MNRKPQRWLVLPDIHVPYEDKKTLHAVEEYLADHTWDGLIYIGDFMDFDIISSHNKNNLRAVEARRISDEYADGRRVLDRHLALLRKRNPAAKAILLEGNHEYRAEAYLDANPMLEGMFEVENGLGLTERKVKWVRTWSKGETYTIGNAKFHHGLYTTQYHSRKMADVFGTNIFYGHTHDVQSFSREFEGEDKTIVGQSLGCLCLYRQGYMRGKPSKWQQAFGVFHFFPDGNFSYYVTRIFKHRFVSPEGRVYDGSDYKAPVRRNSVFASKEGK